MATKRRAPARRGSGTSKAKSKIDVVPGTSIDEYGIPHLGWLAVFIVGLILRHQLPSIAGRAAIGVGILAASAVLAAVTFRYAKARDDFQQLHAAATPLLGGLGLAITLWVGMRPGWVWTYLLAGITLGLTWNVRNARVVRGEGGDKHEEKRGWDEVVGLPGSRARIVEEDDDKVRVRIRAAGGQGRKEIAAAAEAIGNLRGDQAGSARILPTPSGRGDEADAILMKKDVLAKPLRRPEWDGKRRSITEGLRIGRFEDATVTVVKVAGGTDHESPANLQVMGASRSGKSHLFRLAVLDIAESDDCVLWVSDTIKGRQTIQPLLPAIDWFEPTKAGSFAMFKSLMNVVRYQADELGKLGLDEWKPGCGFPLLIAWIEEAAMIVGDSETFTKLCATALSAGVVIVNSMQRASYDNMPTSARANIGAAVCFAVQSPTDAGFILPDDVMDSCTAHLWYSDLAKRRGYYYAVGPGIDTDHRVTPGRTWSQDHDGTRLDPKHLAAMIAARAPGMARLTAGTANAAGQAYADRTKPGAPDGPPVAADTEEMDELLGEWDDDDYDEGDDDLADIIGAPVPDPDDARDLSRIDPRVPLQPAGANRRLGPVGTPGPPLTGAARHAAWLRVVDEVAGQIKPDPDGSVLVPLSTEDGLGLQDAWLREPGVSGSTRPWLHERLNAWIELELCGKPERGKYRLMPELLRRLGTGTVPVADGDEDGSLVRTAREGAPA